MLTGLVSYHQGSTAIQRSFNRLDQAADQIAKASLPQDTESKPADLIKPVTELKSAELESRAAIKLLDAESEQRRTLLDVIA
ncbi:hypothetical protein [Methylococcus sp. EFPC2]|uniref:hypothetical protein n=1 Tax=Methylococcus sp. EFPC2 TaxID=2812648 RepID=UPI001967A649|nr:hypothetical protein [Methylococcus sp. EFPC2]QSA96264.1 hypothetical protein JWZ97_13660 [Methylococcus sp. EFPC2]